MTRQHFTWTILLAVTVFFASDCFAQTDSATVNKIRKTVAQINKDTTYTTKTLENEEFMGQMTDGGGDITGYFKNGQLVKIVERIGLSSCVNITEYYFEDSKLIFVYAMGKEFLYVDSIATFDYKIQNVTMECRFYFDKDKIVKKVLKGQTRCGGQLGSADWTIDFVAETTRYKKLFAKK